MLVFLGLCLYHLVTEFGLLGFLIVSYPFIPTKILIATLVYSKQGWLNPTILILEMLFKTLVHDYILNIYKN